MRFAEIEKSYRELEDKLVRDELTEDEFMAQAAQLRLVDDEGHRWMLSPRTGRWLVHDGRQWVTAEPSRDTVEEPAETETQRATQDTAETVTAPPAPAKPKPSEKQESRPLASRLLVTSIVALLAIGCLIGGGISGWVFFLRDWGEAMSAPTDVVAVAPVETYTPRPATPTYTPTWTPTPSRTPTPTITPLPSDTPQPTDTPPSTPTNTSTPPTKDLSAATSMATTPDWSPTSETSTGQTYVVKEGETLSEIARRFGISVKALAEANGITDPTLIRAGQVLIIPAPGPTPTPTWTPIILMTPEATATSQGTPSVTPTRTATPTPTPSPTKSEPTATPKPTKKPKATPTATPKPVTLSGKIAFTVWNPHLGTGKYELYVSNIDGSGRNLLGVGFRQPQFRPDGNLLAANGDGAPNLEHLVTMDASGNNKNEVSNYSEDSFPAWSPDGAIVAYSSTSWGDGQSRLGIVHDMLGKNQNWIPIGTTEIRGEYPFWMSDGRVVYRGCDFLGGGGNCGLYWVAAGGGNYHRLTTHESDTAPAGSGARVAFMSARDGNWEVYALNMDGSSLKRLTNNNAQDGLPTWSPDGKSIAFVSNRGGAWAIWVMNADGNNQRKLFDLDGGYGSDKYDWTAERISWAP
jgi:Tol biopolymer transport system component/LysM repeat protein